MIIREANFNDAEKLGKFATKAFYDAYEWYNTAENMRNYVNTYFSIDALKKEILDDSTKYFVVEIEGSIVGYAKIGQMNTQSSLANCSHSEIERLYVDEKIQRRGIGLLLIQHLVKYALQRKNTCLWLGVWQKNEKAVSFYQKNGFEIFGTTTFVLGDDPQDDYLMKLEFTA